MVLLDLVLMHAMVICKRELCCAVSFGCLHATPLHTP